MRAGDLTAGLGIVLLAASATLTAQDSASPRAAGTRNAIVGKVVDQSGGAVPATFVTIVERDLLHGVARFHPVNVRLSALTDHRGEYRLENLPPGEFFVVAIPQNLRLMRDGRVLLRVFLDVPGWRVKTVRYKGMDVGETGLDFIDFTEGQEISGIEIELTRGDGRGGATSGLSAGRRAPLRRLHPSP
jgi:hypothetical protein